MQNSFTPSINIVRDFNKAFNYIPTPNARRIYEQIISDFRVGIHAFNIIGSYGTGKSAFLLALGNSLRGRKAHFGPIAGQLNGLNKFHFLNFVGDYTSITNMFARHFKVKSEKSQAESIFSKLESHYEERQTKNSVLLIIIDEFGKFLEYAAGHNAEKELYFVQQLAEYATGKNIILITTLHQSFGSYSLRLQRNQQQEWEKVKGRLKELTFNEPVEQLLFLAAKQIEKKNKYKPATNLAELIKHIQTSNAFPLKSDLSLELANQLFPLDLVSAALLTLALQRYGQNERSLFTFLESNDYKGINDFDVQENPYFNLSNVYDYLLHNYYSFLSTKYNPHYIQWTAIRKAIERIEGCFEESLSEALKLIKTIGLLNIFGRESVKIDSQFLSAYAEICLGIANPQPILRDLESSKLIRYVKFKNRFILFEGTDLDIELALSEAENKTEPVVDLASGLKRYFHFPYISAKSAYYKYGTPRFFEFELSNDPTTRVPTGSVDGIINLILSEEITEAQIIDFSQNLDEAILFGFYKNPSKIRATLLEIAKTNYVIDSVADDRVALRELKSIRAHQIEQLNDHVLSPLYSEKKDVTWIFAGDKIEVKSSSDFNRLLSQICEQVYKSTPIFQNELVNRHKLSSPITIARRSFFEALLNYWDQKDLAFPKDKFPAEKAIYYSLLKKTGIHEEKQGGACVLRSPEGTSFKELWLKSEAFLNSAKVSRKNLVEFVNVLAAKPLKLKAGFVDIWLPLFLFIKRDDFALFGEHGYIPYITTEVIELIIKKPNRFQIKTFDVTGVKLDLFNKYRELLNKKKESAISNQSFVDTIKPFLTFYKELPEYSKKTKRLSKSARALREAIANATEPEAAFFETFPEALGYSQPDLSSDDNLLGDYIQQLQNAVRELRSCFDNLINRIEAHFLRELGYADLDFPDYKTELAKRYEFLKQHLLLPYQKTFSLRLQSQLDNRAAWINSVSHAMLGKTLDRLRDEEEEIVFDKFTQIFLELDNLCDVSQMDFDLQEEEIVKLEMTSSHDGHSNHLLRIPKNKETTINSIEKKLGSQLSKDKKVNISVLTKLLKRELSNGKN